MQNLQHMQCISWSVVYSFVVTEHSERIILFLSQGNLTLSLGYPCVDEAYKSRFNSCM